MPWAPDQGGCAHRLALAMVAGSGRTPLRYSVCPCSFAATASLYFRPVLHTTQYDFPPTYMAERNHHPDCVEALRTALEARRAAAAAALVALRVEPSDTAADAGSADGAQHLAAPGAAKEQEPGVEPEPQKQRVEQSQEEHQAQEGQGLGLGGAAAAAPGGPEDSSAAGL